ncbi:hypothetical protein Tco_0723556 [Tanacetum coccineum]
MSLLSHATQIKCNKYNTRALLEYMFRNFSISCVEKKRSLIVFRCAFFEVLDLLDISWIVVARPLFCVIEGVGDS